jgi:hypothetical protein
MITDVINKIGREVDAFPSRPLKLFKFDEELRRGSAGVAIFLCQLVTSKVHEDHALNVTFSKTN